MPQIIASYEPPDKDQEINLPGPNGVSYDEKLSANSVSRLIKLMGEKLAPRELREHERIAPILEELGYEGTMNQIIAARLYTLAMYHGDLSAIKLIRDVQEGKKKGDTNIVMNFISPPTPAPDEKKEVILESDSWTTPVKSQTP